MRIPTIKVVSAEQEQGFYLLNKSDFDSSIHKEFIPSKAELVKQAENLGIKVTTKTTVEKLVDLVKKEESKIIEEDL